jgi:tyrosyl-tRNA synthetase
MSLKDDLIKQYFELTTDIDLGSIDFGKNPMELKKQLAFEIVKIYHGEKEAQKAKRNFENVFQRSGEPENLLEIKVGVEISASEVVASIVGSKSEAKRLFEQGAIEVNGETEKDPKAKLANGQTVRIGKKKFVKIAQISK